MFSLGCQLWHIRAFSGFTMSPLSPQVKENTLDPTHGAAVSAVIEASLPGKRGTPWVNGGGRGAMSLVAGSSVTLSSTSLSFSTASCWSPALLFSPYSSGPLLTPSRAFSDAKRPHTSKPQHAPYLPLACCHEDIETDQEPKRNLEGIHRKLPWLYLNSLQACDTHSTAY